MTHPEDTRAPPPRASPLPNTEEPMSGDFDPPAPDRRPTRELPVTRGQFRWWRTFTTLLGGVGSVGTLALCWSAYKTVLADARAQTTEQLEPVKLEQKALREQSGAVLVELHELRQDQREAYKAQHYDRTSPRLEAPLPPLAMKDGGP